MTGEFPAQRTSYAENVSIWWRHHECIKNFHVFQQFSLKQRLYQLTHAHVVNTLIPRESVKHFVSMRSIFLSLIEFLYAIHKILGCKPSKQTRKWWLKQSTTWIAHKTMSHTILATSMQATRVFRNENSCGRRPNIDVAFVTGERLLCVAFKNEYLFYKKKVSKFLFHVSDNLVFFGLPSNTCCLWCCIFQNLQIYKK